MTALLLALMLGAGPFYDGMDVGMHANHLTLQLDDDVKFQLGTGLDYWMVYNSTGTQWELWTTDSDGAGTDATILTVADGGRDVTFLGEHTKHGQLYVSTSGDVSIGAQSTWYRVAGGTIAYTTNDFVGFTDGTGAMIAGTAGDYAATWHVSFAGLANHNYMFTVTIDADNDPATGSPSHQYPCEADRDLSGTSTGSLGLSCIIDVAAGEYVYLSVQETGNPQADITIEHASLVLTQL